MPRLDKGVLKVTGRDTVIANIYATKHESRERFRVTNRRFGQLVRDLGVQLSRKETGYMARNLRLEYTPDEMGFDVFWDPTDFEPYGLPFYPLFVELGTIYMPASPALRPAYEAYEQAYKAAISSDIKAAMRDRGSRK